MLIFKFWNTKNIKNLFFRLWLAVLFLAVISSFYAINNQRFWVYLAFLFLFIIIENWLDFLTSDNLVTSADNIVTVGEARRQSAKMQPQSKPQELSIEDRTRVAVHEAGHALCYAAYGENLPKELTITMRRQSLNDSLGTVKSSPPENKILSNEYLTWNASNCLAGQVAEKILLGEKAYCSHYHDFRDWTSIAKILLGNEKSIIFYADPQNSHEEASNQQHLLRLRTQQESVVYDFLNTNKEVLDLLSKTLLEGYEAAENNLVWERHDLLRFFQAYPVNYAALPPPI